MIRRAWVVRVLAWLFVSHLFPCQGDSGWLDCELIAATGAGIKLPTGKRTQICYQGRRSDRRVRLPLQRTDRPPSEASRRKRRHDQDEQRLCCLWLPCSMRPMRQNAGDPVARHGLSGPGVAGRRLIAARLASCVASRESSPLARRQEQPCCGTHGNRASQGFGAQLSGRI
jgi:hypothetical protein